MFLYIDLPRFDFPVIFSEPASVLKPEMGCETDRFTDRKHKIYHQRLPHQQRLLKRQQHLFFRPRSRLILTFGRF